MIVRVVEPRIKPDLPGAPAVAPGERRVPAASLATGLVVLLVYLATLAPGLTWAHDGGDGGDLISAAYHLGVPHPPGYPLYAALGYLVAHFPLGAGDVALRFNVLSAVAAAGAVVLLVWAVARDHGQPAGLLAGLTLALGPIYWSQAVIAEVYALNVLAVAVLVLLVLGRTPRWGWIGLIWGISWATHLSSALLLPLVLVRVVDGKTRLWPAARGLGLGWLAGVTPYLLLPLFAVAGPPINWGNPTTPERWWWLVSGRLYSGFVFGLPPDQWPVRFASLGRLVLENLTVPGALLAAWGAAQLTSKDRMRVVGILGTMVAMAVYALGYNTTDSYVLLLPVLLLAAWLVGVGIKELGNLGPGGRLLGWAALVIPLYLLITGWPEVSLAADHEATTFVEETMRAAPAQAILYTETDRHTFSLWYARLVAGKRPDVTIVDRALLGYGWYQAMLETQDPTWSRGPGDRPVCSVSRQGQLACAPRRVMNGGLSLPEGLGQAGVDDCAVAVIAVLPAPLPATGNQSKARYTAAGENAIQGYLVPGVGGNLVRQERQPGTILGLVDDLLSQGKPAEVPERGRCAGVGVEMAGEGSTAGETWARSVAVPSDLEPPLGGGHRSVGVQADRHNDRIQAEGRDDQPLLDPRR